MTRNELLDQIDRDLPIRSIYPMPLPGEAPIAIDGEGYVVGAREHNARRRAALAAAGLTEGDAAARASERWRQHLDEVERCLGIA